MDKLVLVQDGGKTMPLATCQVMLSGIELMAHIGAFEHEYGQAQPLQVDVTLTVVPPRHDQLDETFDYTRIPAFARSLAVSHTVLIETFALKLAGMCLCCESVLEAEVRIGKPRAVPGCLAGTRVVLRKYDTG